jgi:hypothetical protein
LSEAAASATRVAMVGLAKNTGKTVAMMALLRELEAAGRRVGVTSVGRDGEERDVIDSRIDKPRISLPGGSLVATTDSLLRTSGLPHDLLERTDVRTPLGRVLIARLRGPGPVEVAGPSAATDVRAVSDAMLAYGAEQVLIDGAMDRRAASSPDVADGLVLSTGAVLSRDIDEVVSRTRDAVDLVRLAPVEELSADDGRVQALAPDSLARGHSALLTNGRAQVTLDPRFALTSDAPRIAGLLDAHLDADCMLISGALPEAFARDLASAAHRRKREIVVVVADNTKVFLARRSLSWLRHQGIDIRVLRPTTLLAITLNPLAPGSHAFDSKRLRALLAQAIQDIPIFDALCSS